MRKRVAEIVLLITGALLLAFSVLPHHHHGHRVCFATERCESANEAHDHDKADADCDLKQLFVMSGRYDQAAQQFEHGTDHDGPQQVLYECLPTREFSPHSVPGLTRAPYSPYVEPAGSRYAGKQFSLRAPPASMA